MERQPQDLTIGGVSPLSYYHYTSSLIIMQKIILGSIIVTGAMLSVTTVCDNTILNGMNGTAMFLTSGLIVYDFLRKKDTHA
ncbi:hypothetical protein [Salicibibacter cibarius]|uniref:hypothetical protein n=1 Tax=Salicibibacter cibarius TaxID=2743000 RepID=UPI001B7D8151|nr:hypothetical protein [Salicibibacter cibarius]